MGTHLAASQKPRAQAKPGWPAVLTGLASKAPAQPCDILAGRLCCASPGTKRRGGDCWQGAGRAREAFPPARSTGCQHPPQHLSPPTVRGRRQSPARWVPYIYVPRRALGNVPGAMPPHLPQHELMRSASPGFTLALPPPAAAFRSHPEGRSLAVLRRPPGAPALFAPSTWFLSLHFLEV